MDPINSIKFLDTPLDQMEEKLAGGWSLGMMNLWNEASGPSLY